MKRKIDLSIVLPVFNEEQNMPLVISKYLSLSKKCNLEVLFVEDGGSKDNTRKIVQQYEKKFPFVKGVFINERGYGISIHKGLLEAKGEFVCWTHADLQTNPEDTIKALNIIKKQKNPKKFYIKGKRYGRPLYDSFFTLGMSILGTLYLGKLLFDINAQPNLFHKSFLTLMKNPPNDFSFDLYSYYIAKKFKYKIVRFPVYFGKRIYGKSAWNSGINARMKFIKRTLAFTFKLKKQLK